MDVNQRTTKTCLLFRPMYTPFVQGTPISYLLHICLRRNRVLFHFAVFKEELVDRRVSQCAISIKLSRKLNWILLYVDLNFKQFSFSSFKRLYNSNSVIKCWPYFQSLCMYDTVDQSLSNFAFN